MGKRFKYIADEILPHYAVSNLYGWCKIQADLFWLDIDDGNGFDDLACELGHKKDRRLPVFFFRAGNAINRSHRHRSRSRHRSNRL